MVSRAWRALGALRTLVENSRPSRLERRILLILLSRVPKHFNESVDVIYKTFNIFNTLGDSPESTYLTALSGIIDGITFDTISTLGMRY